MKKKNELAGLRPLEPHQRELLSFEGFEQVFIRMIGVYNTYEEAYEAVERQYTFVFGERKYKSYESFKAVRGRIHAQKRNKNNLNRKK